MKSRRSRGPAGGWFAAVVDVAPSIEGPQRKGRYSRHASFPEGYLAPMVALVGSGLWLYGFVPPRDRGVALFSGFFIALIVVPFLWKSFVIRQGRPHVRRAVLAGAGSAFMIMWLPWVIDSVPRFLQGRRGEEGLAGLLTVLIPFLTLIAVVLGAGLAALAAFVQARLWPGPRKEAGTADLVLDGVVGGALVATLVAPFAAIVALQSYPDGRDPGMNLVTFTAGMWLILVPAGALMGVRTVRRRTRSSKTRQLAS